MDPEVLQTYLQEFANQMRNSFAEQLESNKISILEQVDAKFEKFYRQNKNPIQLGKVDEGNFNFPISSLPKGEGVGELKFPKSLPDVAPILEAVSYSPIFPVIAKPVEPNDLISSAESSPTPSYECPITREETICTTISDSMKEKAEKSVSCQNQVGSLYFFYEYEIPKRYLRVFLHLEDVLYDLYEFNISKFLFFW